MRQLWYNFGVVVGAEKNRIHGCCVGNNGRTDSQRPGGNTAYKPSSNSEHRFRSHLWPWANGCVVLLTLVLGHLVNVVAETLAITYRWVRITIPVHTLLVAHAG